MKFDEYELELLDLVENSDEFKRVENYEDILMESKVAAKNYLNKSKNINIRIPQHDMLILKRKSAEANIPYQTILSSLIHQFATDKIKITI